MSDDPNDGGESDDDDGEDDLRGGLDDVDLRDGLDDVDADDPFAELGDVDDVADGVADIFTEVEIEEIDEEAVWEELSDAEEGPAAADPTEGEDPKEGEEAVVPKSRYCERCEHFSEPPAIGCTNPGTEIRELVDNDSFRVYNCPIVKQRRGDARTLSLETESN